VALVLASSTALLPAQQAFAASPDTAARVPAAGQTQVRDVALQPGGVLQGQVLDAQGKPSPDMAVSLLKGGVPGQPLATTRTDRAGQFQIAGLSGGLYGVQTSQSVTLCRLWAPNTAPPAALPAVMVAQGDDVARGQEGEGGIFSGTGGSLLVVAGVTAVAAAIAIPLSLHNNPASP
jgi:hypothetical protein